MPPSPVSPLLFVAALLATGCVSSSADRPGASEGETAAPSSSERASGVAGPAGDQAGPLANAEPEAVSLETGPPRENLSSPPGMEASLFSPLEGEALDAALVPLDDVRAALPEAIAADSAGAADPLNPDVEPPLQAQRLFGRAQQARLNNDHAEAVQMLEAAARLAPGEPKVLRELARAWLSLGNRPRAIQHLQEAVRLGGDDLGDIDDRLLLGQLLVSAGEPEAGLAELLAVLGTVPEDPAIRPFAAYQAGRTLAVLGRLDAALEAFELYRSASREGLRPTRAGAGLVEVDRTRAVHLAREGDLHLRMNRPEAAAAAYDAAASALSAEAGGALPSAALRDPSLLGRLVYANLRLGRDGVARERLVEFTRQSSASPVALAMISWAVESGLDGGPMVEQLRELETLAESGVGETGDSAALALTLAVSLPRDEAIALLAERQGGEAFEPRVYDALLGLLLDPELGQAEEAGEAEQDQLARSRQAVERVLEVLRMHPDHGHLATVLWLRRAGGAEAAAAALDAAGVWAEGEEADDAAAIVLRTVVERQAVGDEMDNPPQASEAPGQPSEVDPPSELNQPGEVNQPGEPDASGEPADPEAGNANEESLDRGIRQLTRALELEPALALARVERARLLGLAGRHADALDDLDALRESAQDPRVPRLRVGLLLAAGRQAEAAAALERLTRENPQDVALVLQRAQLLATAGDAAGAERVLLDALSANSKSEPVYAALLRLYDDDRLGPSLADYPQNYERLRRRIFQEIPQSRVARLVAAEFLLLRNDFDQARRVLGELIQNAGASGDRDAELLMLELLVAQNDAGAEAFVEGMLERRPSDPVTLMAARDFFGQQTADGLRNLEKYVSVLRRLRDLQEPGFARVWSTANIRALEGNHLGAAQAALEALPLATGDQVGAALSLLIRASRELPAEDSASVLSEAVELAPDFADDLAFVLADVYDDAGQSDKAEAVLLAALEASPNSAQLNNSVGYRWAYRGIRLEEAERLIGRAVAAETDNPAYLDSLGWVLYQQGRFDEALGWLQQSREKPGGINPVILLHLGDALHRVGRTEEAEPVWALGLQASVGLDPSLDPELVGIADRLQARLDAAEAGEAVPVAKIGAEPGESGGDVLVSHEPDEPEAEPAEPAEAVAVEEAGEVEEVAAEDEAEAEQPMLSEVEVVAENNGDAEPAAAEALDALPAEQPTPDAEPAEVGVEGVEGDEGVEEPAPSTPEREALESQ